MGQRFLIDTCVIVKFLNDELCNEWLSYLDDLLDSSPIISFVTEIELLSWKSGPNEEISKRKIVINELNKVYINQNIIDQTIFIRRETNVKIPDSIIAATALVNNLILISTNHRDFDKIKPLGLAYVNPEKESPTDL